MASAPPPTPSTRSPVDSFPAAGWTLITAPDERERCCVLHEGRRCERPTAFRVAGPSGALDEYTYVCAQDLELVRRPDDIVTSIVEK
jgi:hypothetical protein